MLGDRVVGVIPRETIIILGHGYLLILVFLRSHLHRWDLLIVPPVVLRTAKGIGIEIEEIPIGHGVILSRIYFRN